MERDELLAAVWEIAITAGTAIMAVYKRDFSVRYKADRSPITQADLAADQIIVTALQDLCPDYPIISEERFDEEFFLPDDTTLYWLVDPLDGTQEFVDRTDEFTVNIALIAAGQPVLGVVHAPALYQSWGSVVQNGGPATCLAATDDDLPMPIQTRSPPAEGLTILSSRNHDDPILLEKFLADQRMVEHQQIGSSLKFCRLAEGAGDLYPRLRPTHEWDTAAGHAILNAAGGRVVTVQGDKLEYGKSKFLNPPFIAWGR